MQSEALKPCPFCGGQAERVDIEDGDNSGGSFVHCTVCDASGNIEFEFKENFISNWNRRAALETALSAAEPVATVAEMGAGGMRVLMPHPPGSADHLPIGTKLYAAPPAPSVAVKALEWDPYNIDMFKAETFFGYYAVTASGMWCLRGIGDEQSHQCENYEKAFEEAQADYEARIRSALAAQVQDVAGWQSMDTAPKDGTQILAFEIGGYFNCWWHDNGYGEQYWMDEADSEPNPTHWMPLPAAPAKQEG